MVDFAACEKVTVATARELYEIGNAEQKAASEG